MKLLSTALFFLSGAALADSAVETQVRNSYLTLSAFECAVVAIDDKERERLFMLGLKAGREFIAYAQAHPETYVTDFKPKVAIVWNMTSGPSPDFILGQIFANRADDVYRNFSSDEELWKMKKGDMYLEMNCALLGK